MIFQCSCGLCKLVVAKASISFCCQTKARQFETAAFHAGGRLDYAKKQETELSELRQKQMKLENEVGRNSLSHYC